MDNHIHLLITVCLLLGCGKYSDAQACANYTWIQLDYSYSSTGSTLQTYNNQSSYYSCQDLCFQNPSCTAIDYNNPSTCVLFSTTGTVNNTANGTITNHFKLVRNLSNCDTDQLCVYTWTASASYHSTDGTNYVNYTKLDTCISACQKDENCYAIDWDIVSFCWLHKYPSISTNRFWASGVYQFVKIYSDRSYSTGATQLTTTTTRSGPATVTALTPIPLSPTTNFLTNPFSTCRHVTSVPSATTSSSSPTTTTTSSSSSTTSIFKAPIVYETSSSSSSYSQPFAIKPAYIVLAGLGGGCVLLVIVAVVLLCQNPLHAGEASYNHFPNKKADSDQSYRTSTVESYAMGEDLADGGTIVESNPYYNRDDMDNMQDDKDDF